MTRAVIGSLRVNLGLDTAAFVAGFQSAQRHLASASKQMQQLGRQMSATVTAPLTLLGVGATRTAADFEQAMSNMAAVLRPTQEEFRALEERAIALAQTTKYTAKEAADGMEMLARNGIDAANILGGAAEATLNLASSAKASLPSAADAMTDVMVAFHKSGTELTDVVNNIAGTLVNSKMGWDDYYGAMSQAAGISASAGMSFSDMNAILAATAPAFKSGVEAGTSLKGFLLKLAPSSKQAKEIMKDLNLEFYNSQGFLKSAAEIAEELRVKVGRLTKEAQVEVLGALFGQRTIRTALRLMEEGGAGIDRFREKIAQGDAEAMAKTRLDNFWGSWNMLRAAVESVAIAIGNSGLLEWARGAVDAAAELARNVAAVNPELLRWGTIMAAIAAAAGPAILAAGLFAAAVAAISAPVAVAIVTIAAIGVVVAAFWSEVKAAATYVSDAFVAMWDAVLTAGRMIANVFSDIYEAARMWLVESFTPIAEWMSGIFDRLQSALAATARSIGNVFSGIYESAKKWLVDKFVWIADGIRSVIDNIIASFKWLAGKLGLSALADALKNEVVASTKVIGNGFDTVKRTGVAAAEYVTDAWKEAAKEISNERILWKGWTTSVEKPKLSDDELRERLSKIRPSDEVDLGLFGEDTYDSTQHDDANRIIKGLGKSMQDLESEAERVRQSIRTPLETFQHEMKNLNALVQSGAIGFGEYERAVANLQDDFSGITQAAETLSQSFGSAFENMLLSGAGWRDTMSSLLKDVAREILRLSLITPMMDSIKGGIRSALGGGSGGLGSLLSFLPGFATGGSFQVGGAGGIDSQLVAFRASPNERVSITRPQDENNAGRGGSPQQISVNVDVSGARGDREILDMVATGVRMGISEYDRNLPVRFGQIMERNG